jgi:hypothetical protein
MAADLATGKAGRLGGWEAGRLREGWEAGRLGGWAGRL